MKQKLPDKTKRGGLKGFWDTNMYSFNGILNYYLHETSARRHLIAIFLQALLIICFKPTPIEILILVILVFLILSVELINTAIESICDLVSPEYNELIKIAKDSGSGATYVISSLTAVANLVIFIPLIF